MPKLIKADSDFDKDKAKSILKDIEKAEKQFDKYLKMGNAAYKKMFNPKVDAMTASEFNKLSKEYKQNSDKAIELRKKVNKLAGEFKDLTGKEVFRAHELKLTAGVAKAANEANLFDSKSLVDMVTRELSRHSWLKIKVLDNKTDSRELTVEIKETPELGIDHFIMKSIYDLHKKLDQKARQQGYFGLDTMLLIQSKSTAHLIMSTLDGD